MGKWGGLFASAISPGKSTAPSGAEVVEEAPAPTSRTSDVAIMAATALGVLVGTLEASLEQTSARDIQGAATALVHRRLAGVGQVMAQSAAQALGALPDASALRVMASHMRNLCEA